MRVELFPFQKTAVTKLRASAFQAITAYQQGRSFGFATPHVISLQAPTGSGKTIIMSSFIEDVYFGNETFAEQPDAIFVWLSDSPQLNEQSKQKIDRLADKIKIGQCVTIEDESFDMEMLADGQIYFLNTQKLGKAGNLGRHSDTRQYTIWETLQNTANAKADRLYFIIDEAHRGMQGREAGKATSIMQRFLKGSPEHHLFAMPVVIGMSATAERFNKLVGQTTTSTMHNVIVTPNEVRASGLLKDRIMITYPEDSSRQNDMAVLQAATDEWKMKCDHWYQYSYEQHYAQVNPVFVIQVKAGSSDAISDTNLDDVLAKIEERLNMTFKAGEVVHTFGSTGIINIHGLNVPHVDPSDIADDRRIRIVFFKENLSTGWDCPRAETMMSFRAAQDATYIAQLLGRMVRTPLQCHINVDEYLNDVRLYLPYFDANTVQDVINELQATEGGDIPTYVESESLDNPVYVVYTSHTHRTSQQVPGQISMTDILPSNTQESASATPIQPGAVQANSSPGVSADTHNPSSSAATSHPTFSQQVQSVQQPHPQQTPTPLVPVQTHQPQPQQQSAGDQLTIPYIIDRDAIRDFINRQGFLNYRIRPTRTNGSYMRSLLDLAAILTQTAILPNASIMIRNDVVKMIHDHAEYLHQNGQYDTLSRDVLHFKLLVDVFDVFGESLKNYAQSGLFDSSDSDLDRQLRAAEVKLGSAGFCNAYGQKYYNPDDPNTFKVDCILFAADDSCITSLSVYAETKFNDLNDTHRRSIVSLNESYRNQYDSIVANSDRVTKHNFCIPEIISYGSDPNGKRYNNHLFTDQNGFALIKLNGWEDELIEAEMQRSDFICWLRNPSRSRDRWAFCLPYDLSDDTHAFFPDFMIIRTDPAAVDRYIIDILEPHGSQFSDNLAKAKALAKYANDEPRIGRVQLIRKENSASGHPRFKRLDMSKTAVRNKVLHAHTTDELDHIFDDEGIFE